MKKLFLTLMLALVWHVETIDKNSDKLGGSGATDQIATFNLTTRLEEVAKKAKDIKVVPVGDYGGANFFYLLLWSEEKK